VGWHPADPPRRAGCLIAGGKPPSEHLHACPELHPDRRHAEIAVEQVFDPAHPVPQRVPVDAESGCGGIPLPVVFEPCTQRPEEIAAPGSVMVDEWAEKGFRERGGLRRREQLKQP